MKVIVVPVGSLQTNCYVVINGGRAAVIDPGAEAHLILETLRMAEASLEAIYLTHGHADHIAAANDLRSTDAVKLHAHPADSFLLRAADNHIARMLGLLEPVTLDITLNDGDIISLAGVEFRVLATPGHTPGSCCFYSPGEEVLFSGDTLFRNSIGRSDLQGGDAATLRRSLAKLKTLPPDTMVYPGHGASTTIGKERMNNRWW